MQRKIIHKKSRWYYGKILVVEFSEQEENIFEQLVEWLSLKFTNSPTILSERENNEFNINPYSRTFQDTNGLKVHMSAKEFDLLYFLYSHRGQVFTKDQLYDNVWGYNHAPDASNLTSFIRKLRKKIEPDPDNPQYIITVWGVGYKFNEEKP